MVQGHDTAATSKRRSHEARNPRRSLGSSVTIINNDAMAQQLLQTSGPRVTITKLPSTMMDMSHEFKGAGVMGHPGAAVKIVFTKAGVCKFKTRFGGIPARCSRLTRRCRKSCGENLDH